MFDDIIDMLRRQKGRCLYSGIPLRWMTNQDWRMSLERLDNFKGYNKDNCALICWEFNSSDYTALAGFNTTGSSQWSRDKFKRFYRTRFGEEPPDFV